MANKTYNWWNKKGAGAPPMGGDFNLPTAPEAFQDVWKSFPMFQPQMDLLNNMGSSENFMRSVRPEMQEMFKSVGRSGMPSSSWADRNMTNTLGDLWLKNKFNVLSGYQNLGQSVLPWMNQYYQPYNTALGMIGSQ